MTTKVPTRQLNSETATAGQVLTADGSGGAAFTSLVSAVCVFNGSGAPTMISNRGFSPSITDNGVGDYTLTFVTPEPDANFAVVGSGNGTSASDVTIKPHTTTVNSVRILVSQNGVAADLTRVSLAILR